MIPPEDPQAKVLASVPGTSRAQLALLQAQVPRQATLKKDTATASINRTTTGAASQGGSQSTRSQSTFSQTQRSSRLAMASSSYHQLEHDRQACSTGAQRSGGFDGGGGGRFRR